MLLRESKYISRKKIPCCIGYTASVQVDDEDQPLLVSFKRDDKKDKKKKEKEKKKSKPVTKKSSGMFINDFQSQQHKQLQ